MIALQTQEFHFILSASRNEKWPTALGSKLQ